MSSAANPLDDHVAAYQKDAAYALDNSLILPWYPKRIARRLRPGSVLELGIGHGYSTRELSKVTRQLTLLEGSPKIIALFRAQNPDLEHVEVIETFFERFETARRFDNIVMGFVLEHVEDPRELLLRYAPLLAPEGKLFVAVPNSSSMHRRLGQLAGMLPDLDMLSAADLGFGHRRYFNRERLRDLASSVGLSVTLEEGLFLKPFTTAQLEALQLPPMVFEALMQLGISYPELCTGLLAELGPA